MNVAGIINITINITILPLSVCTTVTTPGRRQQTSRHIGVCSQQLRHRGLDHDWTHRPGQRLMQPARGETDSPAKKNTSYHYITSINQSQLLGRQLPNVRRCLL